MCTHVDGLGIGIDWRLDTCTGLHMSVGRLLDSWTMGTLVWNESEQTWFQLQGQMRFANQSWLTYLLSPLRQTFPFFSNSHRDFLSLLSREYLGSVKTSTGNSKEHLISAACYFDIKPCCSLLMLYPVTLRRPIFESTSEWLHSCTSCKMLPAWGWTFGSSILARPYWERVSSGRWPTSWCMERHGQSSLPQEHLNGMHLAPIESNGFKHNQESWKTRSQVKPKGSSNLWIVSPITGGGADRGDGKWGPKM